LNFADADSRLPRKSIFDPDFERLFITDERKFLLKGKIDEKMGWHVEIE
jgi:hypothetical protein